MTARRTHDEAGAALELALVFLTAIAFIVGALLSFASTSSQATVVTRAARGTDYDADGAMQLAIATIRVGACQSIIVSDVVPPFVLNNPARPIHVECATPFAAVNAQRHVVLSVCPGAGAGSCLDADALLRADVIFYDDVTYGRAVSIQSWSNQ